MPIIYAFGDSITYGSWDAKFSGWANRLRISMDKKHELDPDFWVLTYNLGIPGEKTSGLLKRFELEFSARIKEDRNEEQIFIFAYGANDSAFIPSQNKHRTSREEFESNLDQVIKKAKAISDKILMLNITPVVESITAMDEKRESSRLNKYIEKYNGVIEKLAFNHEVRVVDVYGEFNKHDHTELLDEDGLHPNAKGHELIFTLVKSSLEKHVL